MRQRRLEADAQQMAAVFADFPLIQVQAMTGHPPEQYQIDYRVRSLMRGPGGQPILCERHRAEIKLTREYPRQAPKCKLLTPIFHPNIEPAVICVGDHWTAGEGLWISSSASARCSPIKPITSGVLSMERLPCGLT